LIHYLLKTKAWLPKFRSYVEALAVQKPEGPKARLSLAAKALGPLAHLDAELKKHGKRLLR
jgi:hypothetical protein